MFTERSDRIMLDSTDFNFSYSEHPDDERVMYCGHLWLDEEWQGQMIGSFIIETMVRFAYYEGYEAIEMSIGGGDKTKKCLERNGFHIIREREYEFDDGNIQGEYGVDAVRRVRGSS